MKTFCRLIILVAFATILTFFTINYSARAATIAWTNTSGGLWSVSNNWSLNRVPLFNDTVVITNSGTYAVGFDLGIDTNGKPVPYTLLVSNLTLGTGISGNGTQTLLVSNFYPTSRFEVDNQFLITNGGQMIISNGTVAAYPLTIGSDGSFVSYNIATAGSISVEQGAVMDCFADTLSSSVTIAGGAMVNAMDAVETRGDEGTQDFNTVFFGPVSIAGNGVFYGTNVFLYGAINVASGGELDILGNSSLFSPLTNWGTINFTNSELITYNDGTTNWQAQILNEPGGTINFADHVTGTGFGSVIDGGGNLNNLGQINHSTGSGLTGVIMSDAVNDGSILNHTGEMLLGGTWTLLSSSELTVDLNSATDYGNITFTLDHNGEGEIIGLAGAFNIKLTDGYLPAQNTSFNVLGYLSYSGTFSNLNLPTAISWQSTFGSTNLELSVESGQLKFTVGDLTATALVINGTGGTPGSKYLLLSTTNLLVPATAWTIVSTNSFDATGNFEFTNNINKTSQGEYFALKPIH